MNNPINQSTNNPRNEKIFDIHKRIYQWVIHVINYSKQLPKTTQNLVIIPQLVAAVTSVGANDQEADASNSRKDFIAKYVIARKECKETLYWINICKDINTSDNAIDKLLEEGREISYIISTIIKNASK